MQINPARVAIGLSALLLAALNTASVNAEPVGGLPDLNHVGSQMLESHGKTAADLLANVPSRETVGLPVFPGAFYTGTIEASEMMPTVVLASTEALAKVKAWYAGQPGFTYDDSFKLFYRGDEYVMMQTESVYLQDISENPTASAGGLMFNMKGMKTQITISYQPKTGAENE
jgi:hypothetical protein